MEGVGTLDAIIVGRSAVVARREWAEAAVGAAASLTRRHLATRPTIHLICQWGLAGSGLSLVNG